MFTEQICNSLNLVKSFKGFSDRGNDGNGTNTLETSRPHQVLIPRCSMVLEYLPTKFRR